MLSYIDNGTPKIWTGEPVNGVWHPPEIDRCWSDADLNAAGIYRVQDFTVPQGQVISGAPTYTLTGSVVVQTYATAPAPTRPVPAPPPGSGSSVVA